MGVDKHKNRSIRFPALSDDLIKEAYEKANQLCLNEQFIHLLKEEMIDRQLEK
ncbi:sporulation histidine kinase inhibitor Sda [Pseudogracilibacillus auburnensis]|uniref:Sporulation inhibitor A n=1 Tax=Pseudogracilibacillus auburnensis TaxID=1494959 RepID=A0A2V3WAH3_9BACI|nr:sporulation inhibitor A [Pseudogracilibacillus auburnensis]